MINKTEILLIFIAVMLGIIILLLNELIVIQMVEDEQAMKLGKVINHE